MHPTITQVRVDSDLPRERSSSRHPSLIALVLLVASCAACRVPALREEPWSRVTPGTHSLGTGAGWGFVDFDMEIEATSGFLDGMTGTDSGGLNPRAGGRVTYQYVASDHLRLGLAAEVRHIRPDHVAPLGIGNILPEFRGDGFTTLHLMFQPRWMFDPLEANERWRLFCGLDLAWIPRVHLDGDIVYGGGVFEPTSFRGDDYWTIAPVVGASYLLSDRWTFDVGLLYEFSLGETEDDLFLLIVNSDVHSTVSHEGPILFWNFNFHF